ncbi:MAG: hypothetical protein D6730_13285 [Bacteroidetes bacterium]|nr:MAG: hypothetical protein D6730_13285 [Bacteroidota bacterium]
MLDFLIVLLYFALVLFIALSGKRTDEGSSEAYFLSSRNLPWYSIAISTIATNVQGYQFLGMMGSAYLYGLAQANLEINAIQGLWLAAFIFVPLYLKDKVVTITQFIQKRLGKTVGLIYSVANLALFSTIGLGAALFWGAYAADVVFGDFLSFISPSRSLRVAVILVGLGVFSAIYTYYGGLSAVVRTDLIQFAILLAGGILVLIAAIRQLGGWEQLYIKTPQLMHLHLPADHPKLPWIAIGGWFLLNINYWCANQTVVQRSLAARSLRHAQLGLMTGGLLKYLMAAVIIIPGIALYGILGDRLANEPDLAFPYLVTHFLSPGLRGIILCALFASLMSTVDSTFNSLATLWSIDIYKGYLNPRASDRQLIQAGRGSILVTLCTGICMGLVLLYLKFANPQEAFTHTLNELRYYINCGIVVLISAAALLVAPSHRWAVAAFAISIPLNSLFQQSFMFPEMNYFVRAMWVILISFALVAIPSARYGGFKSPAEWVQYAAADVKWLGWAMLLSLVLCHLLFS